MLEQWRPSQPRDHPPAGGGAIRLHLVDLHTGGSGSHPTRGSKGVDADACTDSSHAGGHPRRIVGRRQLARPMRATSRSVARRPGVSSGANPYIRPLDRATSAPRPFARFGRPEAALAAPCSATARRRVESEAEADGRYLAKQTRSTRQCRLASLPLPLLGLQARDIGSGCARPRCQWVSYSTRCPLSLRLAAACGARGRSSLCRVASAHDRSLRSTAVAV